MRVILWLMLLGSVHLSAAIDSYEEKCSTTEGSGVRVDSCDASKFLSCGYGRCRCNDPVNQLYDYRYISGDSGSSRIRRSPKGGKGGKGGGFKSKATPILAGAGGAYVGYQAGKAVGNIQSGGGGTYYSVNSGNSNKKGQNLKKEFACYGRVGSSCVLDYNNVNVVTISTTTTTTTSTTTVAPETNETTTTTNTGADTSHQLATNSSVNGSQSESTTTPTTTSTDLTKIPKCVRNAVCVRQLPSNFSTGSSGVFKTEGDPRLGKCQCSQGYQSTPTDQCVKVLTNRANNNTVHFYQLLSLFIVYLSLAL